MLLASNTGTDPQYIRVSAGEVRYTRPMTMTELTGLDITSVAVVAGLDPSQEIPTATLTVPPRVSYSTILAKRYRELGGFAPGVDDMQILHQVTQQMLIGTSNGGVMPAGGVGSYFMWMQVADDPTTPLAVGFKVILL